MVDVLIASFGCLFRELREELSHTFDTRWFLLDVLTVAGKYAISELFDQLSCQAVILLLAHKPYELGDWFSHILLIVEKMNNLLSVPVQHVLHFFAVVLHTLLEDIKNIMLDAFLLNEVFVL